SNRHKIAGTVGLRTHWSGMKLLRVHFLIALMALSPSGAVLAEAPAFPPPRPGLAAAPAAAASRADAPLDAREIVRRANAYFNGLTYLTGDFAQIGADGRRYSGRLFVQRPGKLRFEYRPPSPLEVISDGSSVVVRDRKL